MIITLTKANFSSCSIGTLTTCNVRQSTVIGATVNISKTSVEKAGYTTATEIATITLNTTNYEGHTIKVMMGSTDVTDKWYSKDTGKVTIPVNTPITSTITISVSATAIQVSGGTGSTGSTGSTGEDAQSGTVYNFADSTWQRNRYWKGTAVGSGGGAAAGEPGHGTYTLCEDYIPVTGGVTYNITQDGVLKKIRFYSWYDANKDWIGGNAETNFDMVAPTNAAYLTISLQGATTLSANSFYITNTQVVDTETKKMTSPDPSKINLIVKEA